MKTMQGKCSFKGMTAAGLCLGIAGFAIYSMTSAHAFFAPDGSTVHLQASHDPLQNGVRIEEKHREGVKPLTRPDSEPAVVLLDNWTYTDMNPPTQPGGPCGDQAEPSEGGEQNPPTTGSVP